MSNSNGHNPEMRQLIQGAIGRLGRDEATPPDRQLFRDWNVMRHATVAQACQFERIAERREGISKDTLRAWLRVFRVRVEQSPRHRGGFVATDAEAQAAAEEEAAEEAAETEEAAAEVRD
jgi:hypothetical protein